MVLLIDMSSYWRWSREMRTKLIQRRLWDIVDGINEPLKLENDDSAFKAWSKKNATALEAIIHSCDGAFRWAIGNISSATIAWDTLATICALPETSFEFLESDGKNYSNWSLQVKDILTDRQLWDIVEGTDDPLKAEKNDMALGWIRYLCFFSNLRDMMQYITSAKVAWNTLATISALSKTGFEFLADDGKNYLNWSLQVKAILTDRQLWDIVEGIEDPPNAEKNDMALGLFRYSCRRSRFVGDVGVVANWIGYITSAKVAWDALAAICALPKTVELVPAIISCLGLIPAVIKHLDDIDNYKDWSDQVKTYLMDQQLWDIAEGTNEPPKAENDEAAFKAWSRKNATALGVIVFSCGYRLRFAIWGITSSKIAWDTLAEICKFPKHNYIDPGEYKYVAWSMRMETYLKGRDLWDIVEAATDPPKPENDEIAFHAWSKKNAIALYLIWESSEAFFSFKKSTRTAKIAWDTLAEYHIPGIENRKYELFRRDLRNGYWEGANQFIRFNPEAESAIISNTGSTALHMVINAGHLEIVEKLVNMLPLEKLIMRHKDGNTVLGFCALVGSVEMAECIVKKCPDLPSTENGQQKLIPVVMALTHNSNTIAKAQYLYSVTPKGILSPTKGVNGATFVTRCIYSRAFEMALDALKNFPTLVTALDVEKESPVLALASMSSAYTSGNHLIFWKQWIYSCIHIPPVDNNNRIPVSIRKPERGKCIQVRNIGLGIRQIYESKLLHHQYEKLLLGMCGGLRNIRGQRQLSEGLVDEAIIKAAKKGMVKFVTEIWSACPGLVWSKERSTGRNPFMCAVLHRQHEIFRLLYGYGLKDSILATTDDNGCNILHMAAMIEPSARRNTVPGAAFHMQREVQWFKEVKSIVHPSLIEAKNRSGHTPDYVFANDHKDLVDEAKNWVKETASSCTVPAALIVTIMFAAAITVPGGNNQNTGLPMFLRDTVFMVFILSDALSLISATTSLLVFLLITSRHTEEDFLISLPQKIILGLSSLIFSIATMMINFCTSLFIILDGNLWVVIPIICLATVPVFLFAWKQFHLLLDMFTSTYRPRIFDRNVKRWI